jgi:hypothetical protein
LLAEKILPLIKEIITSGALEPRPVE